MKERPILFNSDMVNAILEGRKTQTRRVIKLPAKCKNFECEIAGCEISFEFQQGNVDCPYGKVGDQLWVRETFTLTQFDKPVFKADCKDSTGQIWSSIKADPDDVKWKPSIFMNRKYSRIQLEITDIRVERLNDISKSDCEAEGLKKLQGGIKTAFKMLWESINGKGSWDENPWVWVVEFKRI